MERRGLVLRDTCRHWSPPRWRGGVWCQETCVSAKAKLDGEVGFVAEGRVSVPEPI
jgi:hypothetical protein